MLTKEQKARIKALAIKADLNAEEVTELDELMKAAGTDELQKKALKAIDELPTEDDIDKKIEAKLAALAKEPPANRGGVVAPGIKKVSERGDDNNGMKGFMQWIKTGDYGALDPSLKSSNADPMNEQADEAGMATMPIDFYNQVVAKRNEGSIPRLAGARVIKTDLKQIAFPVESTAATYFAVSSNDESAVDEDEPIFARTTITVWDFTKLMKISNDLLMDQKADLEGFLADTVSRAMAITENKYFLTGAGTTVPWGVTVHGTAGITAGAAAALDIDDLTELLYTLNAGYQDGAVFIANPATIGNLRNLGTATFRWWAPTPNGDMGGNPAKGSYGTIETKPIFGSNEMATEGASKISLVYGNCNYYGLVERSEIQVQRLTELYAGNRQTGLLWFYRAGGDVLQAEAFQFVTHPSS